MLKAVHKRLFTSSSSVKIKNLVSDTYRFLIFSSHRLQIVGCSELVPTEGSCTQQRSHFSPVACSIKIDNPSISLLSYALARAPFTREACETIKMDFKSFEYGLRALCRSSFAEIVTEASRGCPMSFAILACSSAL
jgi:hypothetical protein